MVALELPGTPFVPIHDLSNNVVCLLNSHGEVMERYRYTAFGETEIFTPTGKQLPASSLHKSYQYASKRLDPESGLIAFGLRFYDPSLGRWLIPDPAGDADGPNLYTYVHNSPLLHFDRFGLFSDDFDCSWDPVFPTYFIASADDIHHGFAGAFHGRLDFAACQVAGIGSMCCSIGAHEWDDHQERQFSTLAFAQSCTSHIDRFDRWFADTLQADPNNVIYQNFHSVTQTSMEIGSLAAGGYRLIKGGIKGMQLVTVSRQMEKFAGNLALKGIESASQLFQIIGCMNITNQEHSGKFCFGRTPL